VHSPLGVVAQGAQIPARPVESRVHASDRLWDALAMLLILAGTTLFLLARNGLAAIAAGGQQPLPPGMTTYTQRADYFSAQSSLGLGLIVVGVLIGLTAFARHAVRRRGGRSGAAA
jgi:hypothetical protein